ncbi:hypothetical protein Tco_0859119 [Tanacetum coccineum]|uniref:Uncharacterized protein n=1 Tax=Tanacetum coccineum TaxID=301880 RepID=A0ABQ5BDA6_9ASTR
MTQFLRVQLLKFKRRHNFQETDGKTILTKLRTTFENAFNSEFKARMQKYTRFDAQSLYDAMIFNIDSIGKYMLEITLHQQRTPQLLKQKKLMQTQEDHSNPIPALNVDSLKVDYVVIQNTCSEKEDNNSETASSKSFTLDYDSQMTDKYFAEYTGIEVKQFRDTLLQLIGNVKKSVAERTRHQRQYDRRVNKRQMQTQKSKIDKGKAIDDDLVVTESNGTESEVQDDNSRSGNDTDADDADIRPIYDEEPMVEVQLTDECNIFAIGQQHTEQLEIINEGRVDQSKTIEQTTYLLANNADLKAQIQEKVFAIAALKNDLRKLKGNNVDTKFAKILVLGKPVLQSLRNQSVVRQPNAFKSERPQMSKQRFASQVDVNNNLSRPVTQHYLPKKTESDPRLMQKPDHGLHQSHLGIVLRTCQDLVQMTCTADGSKPKPKSNNRSLQDFLPIRLPLRMRKHLLDLILGGNRWVEFSKLLVLGTSLNGQKQQRINLSASALYNIKPRTLMSNDVCTKRFKPRTTMSTEVHQAAETVTTSNELDLLFGPLFDEYFNGENQVVSKSSAVTTTDASNKRQQQPDSTSSTSTLATTVTANGNFDL